MDVLRGQEATDFLNGALHTPKSARSVAVPTGNKLFEKIDERNEALIEDFAQRRGSSRRFASGPSIAGDVFAAMPRFYSPIEYYEQQKVPYDIHNEKHRFELYHWLDHFYRTHYLIPILVDIFTRFPLVGLELYCKDDQLTTFYEELFFDRLDYEHFLTDLGREYWTLGESFPLGHFNEILGIWEEEELLDPTMIKVKKFPIIGGEQFFLVPDKGLRDIVDKRQPADTYYLLERDYPELIPFLKANKDIPISNVLLKQVAFKASPRDLHGTPILLRALRTLLHEEKLMASQDAIAERLYSPLVLVKLGILDMGQNRGPWLPGPAEVSAIRDEFDMALASDFRLIVHHAGIEVQNVFGREQMPRLGDDFDRIERRLMQVFGVNPSLLSGGAASQPYASSALQAEFLNQVLRTYQGYLKKHYIARAKVVAEAQEHYDYEKRGDTRIPITEEVLEHDPNTGEEVIVKKKKLLIPELRMKVLDLRDEATQRQFLQALKQQGVPIPDQDIAMGMHYDFNEALARTQEEMIQKTVAQQEAKVKTYDILTAKGLPIPPDLKAEVEGMNDFQPPQPGDTTDLNIDPMAPGQSIVMPPPPGMGGGGMMGPPPGGTPAIGPNNPMRGMRPEVSDERAPIPPPGQVPNVPNSPMIPGAPGQIPRPAIPPPPGRSSSTNEVDSAILHKLPRKKAADFKVEKVRELQNSEESATLGEGKDDNKESSKKRGLRRETGDK